MIKKSPETQASEEVKKLPPERNRERAERGEVSASDKKEIKIHLNREDREEKESYRSSNGILNELESSQFEENNGIYAPAPPPERFIEHWTKSLYFKIAILSVILLTVGGTFLLSFNFFFDGSEIYQISRDELPIPFRTAYRKGKSLYIEMEEGWKEKISLKLLERKIVQFSQRGEIKRQFSSLIVLSPGGERILSFNYNF